MLMNLAASRRSFSNWRCKYSFSDSSSAPYCTGFESESLNSIGNILANRAQTSSPKRDKLDFCAADSISRNGLKYVSPCFFIIMRGNTYLYRASGRALLQYSLDFFASSHLLSSHWRKMLWVINFKHSFLVLFRFGRPLTVGLSQRKISHKLGTSSFR